MPAQERTTAASKPFYAAAGAAHWSYDVLRRYTDQAWKWSQDPNGLTKLSDRAVDLYDEMAQRGQRAIRGQATEVRRQADRAAQEAERIPGVRQAEGEVSGALSTEADLPIADYDSLTVTQVNDRLPQLSQRELGVVDGYERRRRARSTVLERIDALRGQEPWPGYDEMTVAEILPRLRQVDDAERRNVADYEAQHKNRATVLDQAGRRSG